jgi:hypothetical protein
MTSPPFVLVTEECRGGQGCEFPSALQLLLDLAVKATGCQTAAPNQADKCRLQRGPAEARDFIVDQPEENLDPNSVFEELVPHFRDARKRRQVVIVTHNANLVVNTDATR